ncbi:MAG: FHA domain-containing protein [Planctomycetes bacterium]|nr:FHA domain-containing protein [Planctomycetota bacterium]
MGSILVTDGPESGKYFPVLERSTTIGRSEQCTIQLLDPSVSSRHLQINRDEAGTAYSVADMGSTNGSIVNGMPLLMESPLRYGDVLVIGNTRVVFSTQEFPDRETAASHMKRPGEGDKSTMIGGL